MSDESTTGTQSAVAANAMQALAVKDLTTDVTKLQKQVKALWITVIVIAVIVVILAAFSLLGRVLGVRMMGAGGFRNGTFNSQQFNNTGGSGTQQTTPGQ